MIITPVQLVLLVGGATEDAGEVPPASNDGPFVRRCQRTTGNKAGEAWCASWVTMVGRHALGSRWPVPATGRVQTISDWAVTKNIRFLPSAGAQVGDLFVLWYGGELQRHAHIGFVTVVRPDGSIDTLEGNTTYPGNKDPKLDREGWVVARKHRTLGERDRLIRWAALVTE